MTDSPAIRLDNDMVLERQRVEIGGYTVTLDPLGYSTQLEITLSEWGSRSNAILAEAKKAEDAGDFDQAEAKIKEEREYVAGLVEQVLQAKSLPIDLADPMRMLHAVEDVYGKCAAQNSMEPLATWIEHTKGRLSESLNPGWDKATILDRVPSVRRLYKLLVFSGRLGSGMMGPAELDALKQPPERAGMPPPSTSADAVPSVRKNSQRQGAAAGAASSPGS